MFKYNSNHFKKLAYIVLQLAIIIAIFNGVSAFKQRHMLSTDDTQARQFRLLDIHYQPRDIISPDANKTTLVYFFAPWCTICHLSIGNLERVHQRNDALNIVAIALDYQSKNDVDQFVEKHALSFPILLGNEQVKQAYQISAYPSYYVLDPNGVVLHRSMGYSTELGLYLRSL
ncbi:TlpA disulfide reductase family protein [Thalassotalea ponticola]|uniref:TlpA family protein disulfide reductase n=1 Tax=Thalassotalea ponticola TaxID=1523392 RepID=UPI0025B3FFF6|nr:TlpA disulfide reductase family protein [Thalassotalea ponticola]MDN3651523.1 TlpA disulfide reductase family protein [Thalassotalea ponticola]